MTVVLLWDIDGTLLSTARAGVFALEQAAHEQTGTAVDLQGMPTAGMTDAQIAERVLVDCGAPADADAVADYLRRYAAALPACLGRRRGHVLPGVREALDDLTDEPEVDSLLLTGNVRDGAWAKLRHYDLEGFFEEGAFCEGPGPRADIARAALALAGRRLGRPASAQECVVIGDTPADVECAQVIGARTIGIASGRYDVDTLLRAGAWRAYDVLPAPRALRDLLGLDGVAA